MKYKALLIDIDGTLLHQGQPIEGAIESIAWLVKENVPFKLLTNISARPTTDIHQQLVRLGFVVSHHQIQTASTACIQFLKGEGAIRCHFMLPPAIQSLFEDIPVDDLNPDYVVIGDMQEGFSYASLNRAFLCLRNGARLLAMHRNPYWFDTEGAKLDSGSFVAALEFATRQSAIVTGKPSGIFFRMALNDLGCTAGEVLVIGDDPLTDLAGAAEIGADSLLVATGKSLGLTETLQPGNVDVLPSIAALPAYLQPLLTADAFKRI